MQTDIGPTTASIRRKPIVTYKSPTATEWATFTPKSSHRPSTQPPTRGNPRAPSAESLAKEQETPNQLSFKTPMLPLYHPMGHLALSLPPLDPALFGLPLPPLNYNDSQSGRSRSSSRVRRAVTRVRAPVPVATVSAVAAVAAQEIKDRTSPRKRRQGGGKRKRKEIEEIDGTYPAKRTRLPRGSTAAEDELPGEVDIIPPEEPLENDSKATERRTTRSRLGPKRRGSTASDTPSNEIWAGMQEPEVEPENTATAAPSQEEEEKEEGELSDDGQA